jgi:hypothetical protein
MRRFHDMLMTILFITPVLFCAYPASASQKLVVADFSSGMDKKGVPSGWELKERSGKADISIVRDGPLHALRLRSSDTSFSIQKPVDVNLREYPVFSWKWKVTRIPDGGDFRKRKADDQAAQLFLAFSNSNIIVYIWDSSAPQGLTDDAWAPPFLTIKAVVVRSGQHETGKWITENRNVYEDYRNIFGEEPPQVAGLRIQINSQHTETYCESFFADITFEKFQASSADGMLKNPGSILCLAEKSKSFEAGTGFFSLPLTASLTMTKTPEGSREKSRAGSALMPSSMNTTGNPRRTSGMFLTNNERS